MVHYNRDVPRDRGVASVFEVNCRIVSSSHYTCFLIKTQQNFSYCLLNAMICNTLPSVYSVVKKRQKNMKNAKVVI